MAKEKQLTEVEVKALEIRKEKANKEMNVYSSVVNDLKEKKIEVKKNIVELEVKENERKETIIGMEQEIKNIESTILKKKDGVKSAEKDRIAAKEKLNEENKKLGVVEKNKEKVQKEADAILVTTATLVSKEDYLKNQALYIKNQFKRLGQKYQPYA